MTQPIENDEGGASVRTKINETIAKANTAVQPTDLATAEQAGLMSAADKTALDGVSNPAALLREWTATEAYTVTSATYGASGALTSAVVAWPDGGTGALTVTQTANALAAVDGYNVTHVGFGLRATQPPVTRNTLGVITAQPAITAGAI